MSYDIEIGRSKRARRTFSLDEIALVPSRRTRDPRDVSTAWQIDAYQFDIPVVGAPMDSVMSPATAIDLGRAGGLGRTEGRAAGAAAHHGLLVRADGLDHGVEVVTAPAVRGLQAHHAPTAGRGQGVRVHGAEIVGVRLPARGQRTDHRGRVGVDVGQCAHGVPAARLP